MELFSILLLSGCALIGPPDNGEWNFSVTSSGTGQTWTAPDSVRADGEHYEMLYTITGATVMVSYIGIDFGPVDVMDMIPDYAIQTWRPEDGPCPLDFGWTEVITPEGQDPPSMRYDWMVDLNAKGVPAFHMSNLFLGEAEYNLGWPWGTVTVQIESGTVAANLKIDIIQNPCYEDIDENGIVDVVDLLALIGNWGPCPECHGGILGDFNFDDVVDVTDLLRVVGAWGPCPG
jgi:hypothetical protein